MNTSTRKSAAANCWDRSPPRSFFYFPLALLLLSRTWQNLLGCSSCRHRFTHTDVKCWNDVTYATRNYARICPNIFHRNLCPFVACLDSAALAHFVIGAYQIPEQTITLVCLFGVLMPAIAALKLSAIKGGWSEGAKFFRAEQTIPAVVRK